MAERDMTPDELKRFEHEVIHHEPDESGPASETDVNEKEYSEKRPLETPVPPNPD